ncbi:MAG: hypothetical protein ACR2P1_21905, partial [Pseudomonadales bacterium]
AAVIPAPPSPLAPRFLVEIVASYASAETFDAFAGVITTGLEVGVFGAGAGLSSLPLPPPLQALSTPVSIRLV